ncbi:MAG TPA: hypothetical protein VN619_05630 [Lacisediminihabitans sp.]|jgi:hypothetical protein|nr:hypothetical protein [Lacisediminihabitans sp.]HXD61385.1 hypothetical protein [Lacisediminihabitans sp.]
MVRTADAPKFLVRVHPRHSLVRNGALSYVLLSLPLFGALYFLGAPRGTWPIALAAHLASILVVSIGYVIYRRIYIGVTPTEIHERGVLGRATITPLSEVTQAILVSTYRSSSTEMTQQLLLCDSNDRRLVRMRGIFWTESAMRAVAAVSGAPLDEDPNPMTSAAFFAHYPGTAYWFENRPVLTVVAVVVALVAVLGLVLGLMAVMGIPTEMAL